MKMEPRVAPPEDHHESLETGMDAVVEGNCGLETDETPLLEEDVIDGFAFQAFKTYEDLEVSLCLLLGDIV